MPLPWRKGSAPESRRWSARRIAFGMAAALLLAVCVSWYMLTGTEKFETGVGEQRSVMLADGSRVTLNTASRLSVRLASNRRVIELLKGEALFEVEICVLQRDVRSWAAEMLAALP